MEKSGEIGKSSMKFNTIRYSMLQRSFTCTAIRVLYYSSKKSRYTQNFGIFEVDVMGKFVIELNIFYFIDP